MNAVTEIKRPSLIATMASKFNMDPKAFESVIRSTIMPERHTNEQFAALMMVAKEYDLNPLTKEIYAFPAKGGGIVPVVSIDGWINLINSHPACDGFDIEFQDDDKGNPVSCTCRMYRKDRSRPVVVTEYFSECNRNTDPWKMKHRMLRHKAVIQAGRYAFGFSGIYDEDEAAKIADMKDVTPAKQPPVPPSASTQAAHKPAVEDVAPEPIDEIPHMEPKPEVEDAVVETVTQAKAPMADHEVTAFLDRVQETLDVCLNEEDLQEAWDDLDALSVLDGMEEEQAIALAIKSRIEKQIRG